jgi:hypothetical protein
MPSYIVTWSIDIEADTPEHAAVAALAIQRNPESTAVVFEIIDRAGGHATTVDLQRED